MDTGYSITCEIQHWLIKLKAYSDKSVALRHNYTAFLLSHICQFLLTL